MLPDFDEACGRQTLHGRIKVVQWLIASQGRRSVDMLEVGSWTGHGAMYWSAAIAKLPEKGSLTCVDPWRPYHRPFDLTVNGVCREMDAALSSGRAYELFLQNVSRFPDVGVPVHHYRGTLEEVAPQLGRFDVVFIDGSHYYEDVLKDLRIARTLLKEDGMLVGDDLEMQMDDCDEEFVKSHLDRDCWLYEPAGRTLHPGVTAAVWQEFGRVKSRESVWWKEGAANG